MATIHKGVYAALTTPFIREAVSIEKLTRNIERYNQTGLAGYVVLGSTGEAVFLSDDEAERIVSGARAATAPGKMLIAGASRESARETVSLINRLAGLGAEAALVKPPHYYKARMTQKALGLFFTRVADETHIPIIIYNIPQNTGVPVDPPLVAELARHPNIAAIKDSSGALSNLAETLTRAPARFSFLIGAGAVFLPGLAMGAAGGILAAAAALPETCVEIYRLFTAGRLEEARKLQLELIPVNKALTQTLGIAAVKHALDLRGYFGGLPRSPLLPLTAKEKAEVRRLMEKTVRPAPTGQTPRHPGR